MPATATKRTAAKQAALTTIKVPAIGSAWQGGIYAGLMRGEKGAPDYHLIVLEESADELDWNAGIAFAKKLDGDLPSPAEQCVLRGNVPELFKPTWYWSNKEHAAGSGYAWCQGFTYGCQDCNGKDSTFRVRAVRRSPIQ